MSVFQAILLGAVQGITEFLPISSTGHLLIAQRLLGFSQSLMSFDIALHFASLLAIVYYFRSTLLSLRLKDIRLLVIGTVPVVIVGLLVKDLVEQLSLITWYIAIELIITGSINIMIDRLLVKQQENPASISPLSSRSAWWTGVGQVFGISPAISRSGSTVLAALSQGIERTEAFRFAFLLAIPSLLGATMLELFDGVRDPTALSNISLPVLGAGMITSFLVGLGSLRVFEYVMQSAKLRYFGYYCIVLGVLLFVGSVGGSGLVAKL
ncbi:MAG: undecaprenyl-diphosphate phosphatase [Pseudomonadales bacterium]|nr:undecaprenyl-diphosphate phosphatase [Candidatus Woesebacteria bacterium]MCB9802270.1 undecaprenyl-diphosphate phosphatase [Pseudomonadales bacterium]